MDALWRNNAEEIQAELTRLTDQTKAELRGIYTRLAANLSLAQRHGDLEQTAHLSSMAVVTARRLADWATLRLSSPTPNSDTPARMAEVHTEILLSDPDSTRSDTSPAEVPASRIAGYAELREIDLQELTTRLGPLPDDPPLSLLNAYAEALRVSVSLLVEGWVDDDLLPV